MENFNQLIKEALTPDFLKESNESLNEGKLSKKQTFDMLEKYYNSIEIDGQKNAIDRIVRAKKSKYGYDVWYRIKDQGSDEGSTMSFVYFTDLKKKGLYDDKSLNEEMTDWPKELTSRYSDEYRFELENISPTYKDQPGRAKYRVIDIESGELKSTPVFGKPEHLIAFADDLIKPQGGRQSSNFGESVNEAKELTQDDIYNFLKPKFKDTKRATYEVDKEGKKVVVSWTITKKGYTDSKGDLFIDLEDMDFTDNHGGGKNWDTKAQLLSGLKKHIKDDAKSIFGENKQNNMKDFNKLIKEALTPSFLKENQRQGIEQYKEMGFEVWYSPLKGYNIRRKEEIINPSAYFDTYDEAVEHAEIEIDGYLEGTMNESAYNDPVREKAEKKYSYIKRISVDNKGVSVVEPGEYVTLETDYRRTYPAGFAFKVTQPMDPKELAIQVSTETGWFPEDIPFQLKTNKDDGTWQSKRPVRYEFPTSPTLFDDPISESAINESTLLDNINTLDQYFLDLSPGDPAKREWETYTEDLFYDYSGDGDSGFREVYWDDIDDVATNEAILFAYDLAERYNKNDIPNIYRS